MNHRCIFYDAEKRKICQTISFRTAVKSNPRFCKSCFFLRDQPKGKKPTNFPLIYATIYVCVWGWIYFQFNLLLKWIGCPILGKSPYTAEMAFNVNNKVTKLITLKSTVINPWLFPKDGGQRIRYNFFVMSITISSRLTEWRVTKVLV